MAKMITLVQFIKGHGGITDDDYSRVYGVDFRQTLAGHVRETWPLQKSEEGFYFLGPGGERTYGTHPDVKTAIKKAVSYGLKVYINDPENEQ